MRRTSDDHWIRRAVCVGILVGSLMGCGENISAVPVICAAPGTYVPEYQQCPGSLDGMACVTRVGHQVNEAGAVLPTECEVPPGVISGDAFFCVASCSECQ